MKNLVYRVTISLILMCNLSFSENHILYWINDGNDYEIFKYDMLLEATTQLTDNTFDDAYPVVSPNGEYIYFSSTESGVGNIWRMDMDGGNRTQLTDIQNWSANIDHLIRLDINKENTKIVFSYKIAANGGYFAMYTMDIDGSNIVEISPAVSDYTYPQWSTDGTRILCGNNVPYNGYSQQILEMNADGTGVTTLVPNSTNYPLYPRYSPDGSQITYTRADLDLYMSNLDGSNEINLTNSTGIDEALSVWGMDNWIYYRKDYEVHRISTDGQINELVIADPNYSISAFEPYYDVIDESLIAYYPIDGNSYDESGNGNGGIPMGNPSFSEVDRFGEMSSAVQFDGLDDYIDCGSGLNLNIISDQTLSFWIKTTSTYSGTILSKVLASSGTWTDDAYSISFESDGHIYYTLRNSSENQTLISNAVVNDDNWHFITVRYDQNNVLMSIYVDGIFDNSTTGPSSILSAPDLPLYIGANYTQGDGIEYPINGILDDISIYNRVLSESEIDSLYHIGAWDTDYTVAHWDFDQGTGSELTDISGNGFHGTIDGPQWVDGFHGGALWFDGVDDKVTTSLIPVYDNTESYTWEVIAKIENTDPGQTRAFLGFENSDDGEIKIGMPNQTYYSGQVWATSRSDNYASDGGNVNLFSDTTFVDNYWHHYALVRNRDNLMYYFYLDGTLVDSTEDANVNPINAESNQTLGIGCQSHNSYWDFFFSGWIDEIRLSDEALLPYQFILPVNDIWVLVDSTWGNTQDTISIPVRIESQNNLMLNSAEFTFTYDNIALTFLDVDLSNTLLETADWMYAVNETEAGLNIAGAGNNEITENGVLFNLRFIPTGETCSFVPITVTEAMFNTGSNAVTVANGGVHIEPIPNYGDVDENGMIQAYDAAVLLEHIVGEDTLVCQGLANAEVSLNDTLTALDASLILQYRVDSIDTLPYSGDLLLASGDIQLLDEVSTIADTQVVVPIIGNMCEDIYSMEGTVLFDSTQMSFSEMVLYELSNNAIRTSVDGNRVEFAYCSAEPLDVDGTLGLVIFNTGIGFQGSDIVITSMRINENLYFENLETSVFVGINDNNLIPTSYALRQNYPNPFNPTTTLFFDVPNDTQVEIGVFDMLGRNVITLVNSSFKAGSHQILWNGKDNHGSDVPTGMYFATMTAGNYSKTIKMILMK